MGFELRILASTSPFTHYTAHHTEKWREYEKWFWKSETIQTRANDELILSLINSCCAAASDDSIHLRIIPTTYSRIFLWWLLIFNSRKLFYCLFLLHKSINHCCEVHHEYLIFPSQQGDLCLFFMDEDFNGTLIKQQNFLETWTFLHRLPCLYFSVVFFVYV